MQPIIGITLDSEEPGGYSNYPWYALRKDYARAVIENKAIPIHLAYDIELAKDYINMIDGLIITGGDFDIDPSHYGEIHSSDRVIIKDERTAFEMAIVKLALEKNMPILGICGGEQLLNVVLGGSLIQHIPYSVPNCLMHEQPMPKHTPSHDIFITENSKLHKIANSLEAKVNSTHHQAVKQLGKDLVVTAIAPDGVIEAIEHVNHKFCLGVQWHPEYQNIELDKNLFKAFIEACHG